MPQSVIITNRSDGFLRRRGDTTECREKDEFVPHHGGDIIMLADGQVIIVPCALDGVGLGGARDRCLIKKARQRALSINDAGLFNIRDNMHRAPSHAVVMLWRQRADDNIMSINAILQGNDETALVQTGWQGGTHLSEIPQFGGEQNNIGGFRHITR